MFGIDDAALAAMLAGAISTAGNIYINKKNRDAQADANAINWEIARQNNATQIEMANTAHQREVRDLRAAGLNPILSAGGRGASVPSLQAPTIDPVHQDSPFEGLANSAKGVGRYLSQEYKANLAQLQSRVGQTDATTSALEADAEKTRLENKVRKANLDADKANADADAILASLRRTAVLEESGFSWDADSQSYIPKDIGAWNRAINLNREGVRSDFKLRANANLNRNVSTAASAVNSAAGVIRQIKGK